MEPTRGLDPAGSCLCGTDQRHRQVEMVLALQAPTLCSLCGAEMTCLCGSQGEGQRGLSSGRPVRVDLDRECLCGLALRPRASEVGVRTGTGDWERALGIDMVVTVGVGVSVFLSAFVILLKGKFWSFSEFVDLKGKFWTFLEFVVLKRKFWTFLEFIVVKGKFWTFSDFVVLERKFLSFFELVVLKRIFFQSMLGV